LASAVFNALEVLADGLESLGELFIGQEVNFLFREVYCRLDVRAQVNHCVGEAANHCGEFTLQRAHGRAHCCAGARFYEICDGFCLREVEFVVEEGSLSEFTRVGSATADLNHSIDERFHDECAPVTLQLEDVLAGIRMRRGEEESQTGVDGFLFSVEEARKGCTPSGRELTENYGGDFWDLGS